MVTNKSSERSPIKFFLLVFALSVPFWIVGFVFNDVTKNLPVKLPISALMTFCPLIAAIILVYKTQKMEGVKALLKQALDFTKIKIKWYLPIVFLMPITALLSYWCLKVSGMELPEPQLSPLNIFIWFNIYFISAIGEEIGWSGYVIDPLQNRFGMLKASFIVGTVWAIWHIIPYSQGHHNATWIVWQCIATLFLRVIMVWIFNHTSRSVFAMILFHTMINISPFLIPDYGSNYDPFILSILLIMFIAALTFFGKSFIYKKEFLPYNQN